MIERRWLCLVLMVPNFKCRKEDNVYFDDKGVNVFISKNCCNMFQSGICYMLNVPNGFKIQLEK